MTHPVYMVGSLHIQKCGELEVLKYVSNKEVTVRFTETGFEKLVEAGQIAKGSVKDPYFPTVGGVGYLGVGDYNSTHPAYKVWHGILYRCYDPVGRANKPTYSDTIVCSEWLNYQEFAKWFVDNYKEGLSIDKDILGTGLLYSPSTCCFVTPEVNSLQATNSLGRQYTLVHAELGERVFSNQTKFSKEYGLTQSGVSAVITP